MCRFVTFSQLILKNKTKPRENPTSYHSPANSHPIQQVNRIGRYPTARRRRSPAPRAGLPQGPSSSRVRRATPRAGRPGTTPDFATLHSDPRTGGAGKEGSARVPLPTQAGAAPRRRRPPGATARGSTPRRHRREICHDQDWTKRTCRKKPHFQHDFFFPGFFVCVLSAFGVGGRRGQRARPRGRSRRAPARRRPQRMAQEEQHCSSPLGCEA